MTIYVDMFSPLLKKQKPAQIFEYKACKKVFASHQALDGHQTNHGKVKGCFASQNKEEEEEYKENDDEEDESKSMAHIARKNIQPAHECTIFPRVWTIGTSIGRSQEMSLVNTF